MRSEVETIVNSIIELATNSPEKYRWKFVVPFALPQKAYELLDEFGLAFELIQHGDDPWVRLTIYFGEYVLGSFEINYEYHVTFSKLAKVWKDEYYSRIVHPDPDHISGGAIYIVDHNPLTKMQQEFERRLVEILEQNRFLRLNDSDLDEVILGMEFPIPTFTFFGPQPTVDMLIFKQFWNTREIHA